VSKHCFDRTCRHIFFSYIASIKYVYNNVTHLLLEFCSKYVVCTCESPFTFTVIPRDRFMRAITPATPRASFFAADSISRHSRSFSWLKICAYYQLHVARKSHNVKYAGVRRRFGSTWKMRKIKDFYQVSARIFRICKYTRLSKITRYDITPCSHWLLHLSISYSFRFILHPNSLNLIKYLKQHLLRMLISILLLIIFKCKYLQTAGLTLLYQLLKSYN